MFQDYSELNVPLGDIAVNPYTVSELVRLCLRKQDSDDTNSDAAETEHSEVVSIILLVSRMHKQEFLFVCYFLLHNFSKLRFCLEQVSVTYRGMK